MLDQGVREEVEVSPVGLEARPGALVGLVENLSHLRACVRAYVRARMYAYGVTKTQGRSSACMYMLEYSVVIIYVVKTAVRQQ